MTKAELIKLLEPFTDDIRIVVYDNVDCGPRDPESAEYVVADADYPGRDLGFERGEGYIMLW